MKFFIRIQILVIFLTTLSIGKGIKTPVKVYVRQINSEVEILISDTRKNNKSVIYKSLSEKKTMKKRISNDNFNYFTKGLVTPKNKFDMTMCPENYYILNNKGECLDSKTNSAKSMREFLRKIYYML